MDKDDKYYKELFYKGIADKIRYRKPFNPDNNLAFITNNSVRFKTKGYLIDEDNKVFF